MADEAQERIRGKQFKKQFVHVLFCAVLQSEKWNAFEIRIAANHLPARSTY